MYLVRWGGLCASNFDSQITSHYIESAIGFNIIANLQRLSGVTIGEYL